MRSFALWAFASLGLLQVSCSNYHLGSESKAAFRSIYIAPVATKAFVPQADTVVSSAIRRKFLADNRVALAASPAEADAVLTVVITGYSRQVATVRPGDTGLARAFLVTLSTTATLHDNRANKDLFHDRKIESSTEAYTDSGQLQSEYQNLPTLAELLAKSVASAVLDVW